MRIVIRHHSSIDEIRNKLLDQCEEETKICVYLIRNETQTRRSQKLEDNDKKMYSIQYRLINGKSFFIFHIHSYIDIRIYIT